MNRFASASLCALWLVATTYAAEPPVAKLTGPKTVEVNAPIILNPTGSVGALEFGVALGPGPVPIVTLKSDDGKTVIGFGTAAQAGSYILYVIAWGENVPNGRPTHAMAFWTVMVGDVPPTPGPGPGPTPGPSPDPFGAMATAGPALRCLIVYESADVSKLPQSQLAAMTGDAVMGYLNSHAVKGPDGRTPEWRVWDKDASMANVPPMWQKVMARPRAKLPWIVIGNGTAGYEGPLPLTVEETLALLKKYGGQ